MSVLIRGEKMPEDCWECCSLQLDHCNGKWTCVPGERPKECPLVEIPEPHGRLIDADAFKDYILEGYNDARNYVTGRKAELAKSVTFGFLRDIDERPTIIPAEDGET